MNSFRSVEHCLAGHVRRILSTSWMTLYYGWDAELGEAVIGAIWSILLDLVN